MAELKVLYEKALKALSAKVGAGEAKARLSIFLEDGLGFSRIHRLANPNYTLSEEEETNFNAGFNRLLAGEPVQYICGVAEFYGLKFKVSTDVLIPRPETEELVQLVLNKTDKSFKGRIIDIGTGSGCIAVILANELPDSSVTAIDLSQSALYIARKNAEKHQTSIDFKALDFLSAEIDRDLPVYDIIVSNPPYVTYQEWEMLEKEVKKYEPALALHPPKEKSSLVFYERLRQFAENHLREEGFLVLEINEKFGKEVKRIFDNPFFRSQKIVKDINGKDRLFYAEKSSILLA